MMIRRIQADRCSVGTMHHGPQIRRKTTSRRGSNNISSSSSAASSTMAYRWVIADRIAHWGEVLANSNDKLQTAQKHLHSTIQNINNSIIEDSQQQQAGSSGGGDKEGGGWRAVNGFALFCNYHMDAHPHILQRALTAAQSELKSSTSQQQHPDGEVGSNVGDFSLRFATSWLIASLHSEYRLLSLEERRQYHQHATGSMSTTTLPQRVFNNEEEDDEEEEQYNTTIGVREGSGGGGGMDDLQSAYQRARVELERRHQDDLEGLVMYTLSKTQRLMQQYRPDLIPSSRHQNINLGEGNRIVDDAASSLSVMGIDLGDVVQYPPTGFTSFQSQKKKTKKKSASTPIKSNHVVSRTSNSSKWVNELAELLREIPKEWASLPHDTRTSWAPDTQRRRKLDEAAALHRADCERAQQIIDTSLRHFNKERKRRIAKYSSNNNSAISTGGVVVGGGADHHDALQWLLNRRTT